MITVLGRGIRLTTYLEAREVAGGGVQNVQGSRSANPLRSCGKGVDLHCDRAGSLRVFLSGGLEKSFLFFGKGDGKDKIPPSIKDRSPSNTINH